MDPQQWSILNFLVACHTLNGCCTTCGFLYANYCEEKHINRCGPLYQPVMMPLALNYNIHWKLRTDESIKTLLCREHHKTALKTQKFQNNNITTFLSLSYVSTQKILQLNLAIRSGGTVQVENLYCCKKQTDKYQTTSENPTKPLIWMAVIITKLKYSHNYVVVCSVCVCFTLAFWFWTGR